MNKAVTVRARVAPTPHINHSLPALFVLLAAACLPGTFLASTARVEQAPELTATGSSADPGPATAYYRWIDASGRIQYTDFEPVEVPAERIPLNPETDDAPILSSAGESRTSDPFHDQDQQILPIEHIGPCADARRQLGILHASLPVYVDQSGEYRNAWRGDTYKGQRLYLDAETRTTAISGARQAVLKHCSDPQAFAEEEAAFADEVGRN